jgi:hypothetical protein
MRRILTLATLALISSAPLACSDLGPTAQFATFEHASIEGVVLSTNGTPLDSVSVGFDVPPGRGAYGGGAQPPLTAKDGKFTVSIDRLTHLPDSTPPSPDTLTLTIVGVYRAVSPTDPLPRDTAHVLVRLVPKDEQAPVSSVTLHIDVPQQ